MKNLLRLSAWLVTFLVLTGGSLVHAAPVLFHPATTDSNGELLPHRHAGSVTINFGPVTTEQDNALDDAIQTYNAVAGSSLSLVRGSPIVTSCTAATVEALLTTPGFAIFFCDPEAFPQIGLAQEVLGATQTKTDSSGIFTQGVVLIRNNLVGSYNLAVVLHELGHLVGLDHSRNYSNNQAQYGNSIMFPIVILPASEFSVDDVGGVLTNYATDPTNPGSFFGGIYGTSGACLHGTVRTIDDIPLNGVIVTLHDQTAAAVADKARTSTVTGIGFNDAGAPNAPGEFTLCAPFDQVTHLTAQLCPSSTTVTGLTLSCGNDESAGESAGMMPNFILPYEPSGNNVIYLSGVSAGSSSPNFAGDYTAGSMVTATSGQFLTGHDIYLNATITVQGATLGDSYTVETGGCQAAHHSTTADLSMLALMLAPLAGLVIQRRRLALQKVRVRAPSRGRKVPSR